VIASKDRAAAARAVPAADLRGGPGAVRARAPAALSQVPKLAL
jgi:hypothetical protein